VWLRASPHQEDRISLARKTDWERAKERAAKPQDWIP
jgi:hypothetical protein